MLYHGAQRGALTEEGQTHGCHDNSSTLQPTEPLGPHSKIEVCYMSPKYVKTWFHVQFIAWNALQFLYSNCSISILFGPNERCISWGGRHVGTMRRILLNDHWAAGMWPV